MMTSEGNRALFGGCPALLVTMLLSVFRLEAAVINANSVLRADVAAAVTLAHDGDTVIVPPGVAAWTNALTISSAITLQGTGIGQTIIQDAIGSGGVLLNVTAVANKTTRLTAFSFTNGNRSSQAFDGTVNLNGINANGGSIRLDHCQFDGLKNFNIVVNGAIGVIDHNTFHPTGTGIPIYVFHSNWNGKSYGDGSWAASTDWNGTKWMVIEDCTFYWSASHYAVIDSYRGARWIFRYNTVSNGWCEAHGTESGQRFRGTRAVQVYGNRFYAQNAGGLQVNVRSGTAIVCSNAASGFLSTTVAALATYRAFWQFTPWGGADGTNQWDSNVAGGPFATGSHTGTSGAGILTDSIKSWSVNQWVGYTLQNKNSRRFSEILANTATTITVHDAGGYGPNMVFTNGDNYEIWKVNEALDQAGKGQSALLTGDYPAPVQLNQIDEPVYEWANTVNGSNGRLSIQAAFIRNGEHYVTDVPKPNFIPMTYPHPLVSGTSTNKPPPVTNLRIAPGP